MPLVVKHTLIPASVIGPPDFSYNNVSEVADVTDDDVETYIIAEEVDSGSAEIRYQLNGTLQSLPVDYTHIQIVVSCGLQTIDGDGTLSTTLMQDFSFLDLPGSNLLDGSFSFAPQTATLGPYAIESEVGGYTPGFEDQLQILINTERGGGSIAGWQARIYEVRVELLGEQEAVVNSVPPRGRSHRSIRAHGNRDRGI